MPRPLGTAKLSALACLAAGGRHERSADGQMIDLLRANGFLLERMIELYASADDETHGYYKWVTAEWAKQWPAEELWVATKRG